MNQFTERQRQVIETVLICFGVLACLTFWWHDGNLLTPSYVLFGMGVTAGILGSVSRFERRFKLTFWLVPIAVLAFVPLVLGVVAVANGRPDGVWLVVTFGIFTLVIAEASRRRG